MRTSSLLFRYAFVLFFHSLRVHLRLTPTVVYRPPYQPFLSSPPATPHVRTNSEQHAMRGSSCRRCSRLPRSSRLCVNKCFLDLPVNRFLKRLLSHRIDPSTVYTMLYLACLELHFCCKVMACIISYTLYFFCIENIYPLFCQLLV